MPWIFLLLPWIELWTLIELGAATSALLALGWVFLTLVLGLGVIRAQGEGMARRIREQQVQGGFLGPQWLLDDLALVGSGLLLMVPGLVTDVLAVIMAIGPLRRGLGRLLGIRPVEAGRDAHFEVHIQPGENRPDRPTTIEGDYRRLDD